jgi:outer membrane protein, heavy metal efflux system
MRYRLALVVACVLHVAPARIALAQTALTRADAARTALERGPRLGVARADVAVANAALIAARVYPNPSFSATYSKAVPTYHYTLDVPLELPMIRGSRIQAAQTGVRAAEIRYQLGRLLIEIEADTLYTRAIAARERLRLSRRNALDADSLLHMVERRRDAGDASDMDAELARVNAGERANIAAADSLTMVSAFLDLQAALGMTDSSIQVTLVDSLTMPPAATTPAPRPLQEVAAGASLEAAALNARLQHRSVWSQVSIALGFEYGDPAQRGILPTFGVGIGLPFFDRNRGPIALAEAERNRAQADLTLAQIETRNALAHAQRARANAVARAERDVAIIASANRVASMSLMAYREGALALGNVLEAQATARDLLAQYIDDLAAAWVATAELRVFSATPTPPQP